MYPQVDLLDSQGPDVGQESGCGEGQEASLWGWDIECQTQGYSATKLHPQMILISDMALLNYPGRTFHLYVWEESVLFRGFLEFRLACVPSEYSKGTERFIPSEITILLTLPLATDCSIKFYAEKKLSHPHYVCGILEVARILL